MIGLYFYVVLILAIFIFLLVKIMAKRKRHKQDYEERKDNVFYDAARKVRRD